MVSRNELGIIRQLCTRLYTRGEVVRAVQHVVRRGGVYWWRRRVCKKVGETERTTIAISMRTTNLGLARTIAAHLTHESERMMRRENGEMLSAEQTKAMLTSVARAHLAKLDRVAALEIADGITAGEGKRSDLVMAWVKRLQAARGPAARVEPGDHSAMTQSGLSADEILEVDQTITLLRERNLTGLPRARLVSLLESCGAPQGEGDIREAERICHRAQSAALFAVTRRWSGEYAEDAALIDEVLKTGQTAAPQPAPRFLVAQSASPPDVVAPVLQTDSAEILSNRETSILKLVDQLIANKAKLNEWAEKTQRQVRSVAELFVKMLGEDHVRLLAQDQIAKYKTLLLTLPKQYGKGENDKNLPLSDWLKLAKKLPAIDVGRVGTTLNRHMGQLDDVLSYIRANGYTIRDYSGVTELRANSAGRPRDARNFLDPKDYTALFRLPPWTGCESQENRVTAGSVVIHDALYFVPILAQKTLGRREEICGLDVDDVLEENGIPYIFIRDNAHRRIKNPQSTRRIPLVAEPCRLGFLRYRSAIKALGYKLLFPDLRAGSDRTALGDVFYDGFVEHWKTAIPGYQEQKKVFHSIRKTGGDNLKDAGVASEIRADILGHGGKNTTEERYANAAKLKQMLEALDRLPTYTSHLVACEIRLHENVLKRKPRASAVLRRRDV
jgi:integrase